MKNLQYQRGKIESTALSIIHIIVLTLFIFPATTLWAKEASSDKAKEFAAQFFMSQNVLKSISIQPGENNRTLELQKMYQSPDSVRNPLYCFQNKDAGFVFVSENGGDYLIVGYSLTGKFDPANIPEQLKSMMKTYEQTERFTINAPNNLKSASIVVSPLLDMKGISLNQYNHENVGNCPTGCVATAMAQIMCYYKYPATGTGSHCYTHPIYGQLCADFGNTTYNWTNPTDADYKLLSYHVGVAMNMNYCADEYGSNPSASDYLNVLQKNFKYNVHRGTSESFYLRSELDNNRPVYSELYGDPGHAVVIDGYDSDEYFHLNFGWGGNSNGYYLMNTNSTMDVGHIFGTNIGTSLFISPSVPKTNQQDSLALVSFHNSMGGKTGWDLTKPVVNWPGVLVMNGRVIRLILTGMNNVLEGTIPAEIGNLTALQNLNIKGNITGSFPISITNLTDLKELAINYYPNSSKVSLPSEIGNLVNLESININAGGTIPNTIGNLTKLKSLTLSGGGLTGGIPDELYSLTNLEALILRENQLTGTISPKIGQLTKLRDLTLYSNQLSGQLPVEIGNLIELTNVWLAQNLFSGIIPESIGNWTKLKGFYIDNNAFEGMLPNAIGKFTNFENLTINNNKFTSLPDSIGNLSNLQQIVANTNLINSIPASISKLSKLFRLDLMNNKLTTLPDIGTMPALWDLNLSYNQISVLPESFGKLVKVSTLNLNNNQLTELPSTFGNLTSLKDVSLNQNKLTFLPISVSLLSNLKHLYLMNNQISGALPPLNHLGLIDLNIYNNKLIFSDIAASKMPDDFNYTDGYYFTYSKQAKVAVTDSLFLFAQEDSVVIDIRNISRLSHPDNVYNWYKVGQVVQTGAVLKFQKFTNEYEGLYYCQITNPKYRNLVLLTNPIKIVSKGDSIYTDGYHTTSRSNTSDEISDYQVTLTVPDGVRGAVDWQASIDSLNWYEVTDSMPQIAIKKNIFSITGSKIVVKPKLPLLFRYVVKEETCDPLISDVIKVKPYGIMLLDTMLNVTNKDVTISTDSIEIVFPANFTNKAFRLTINKITDSPAAPDSTSLSSVYDVNVSCGSVFDVPLQIKFKNINKKTFNLMDLNKYQGVYYDNINQKWVDYGSSYVCLKDTSLVLITSHLTKLSWYQNNGYFSGFDYIYTSGRVNVIYVDEGTGPKVSNLYTIYTNKLKKDCPNYLTTHPWLTPDEDPNTGAPFMMQDIAAYTNQIIDRFELWGMDKFSSFWGNFNVYVCRANSEGSVGFGSNSIGRGYNISSNYLNEPSNIRTNAAHEFTHFEQDYYMQSTLINYFWMEATAPLGDRMVWDVTQHKIPEPEQILKQSLEMSTSSSSILDLLAQSWDQNYNNIVLFSKLQTMYYSIDANLASTFLHYMRSYRPGVKLFSNVLFTESPSEVTPITYLNSYIESYLLSNIGDEFESFVKYILEGSNRNFTLQDTTKDANPLRYFLNPSNFICNKVYKFNGEKVIEDNVKLNIPHLASKMVQINNANQNQRIIVKYKRKSLIKHLENMSVNVCKYDFATKKMIFEDISALDSGVFVIDKPGLIVDEKKNFAYLLFINKEIMPSLIDDVNYDLKIYNIPDYSMFDDFGFRRGNEWQIKIHSFTNGTTETLDEFYVIPQIWRTGANFGPMTYSSELTDSTYITQASSKYIEQTTTYIYLTGEMVVYDRENWGGFTATSPIDIREMTMVLNDVWLTPLATDGTGLGLTYSFDTKNTAETQKVVKSISYTRKHALWNEHLDQPGHNPIVTTTYLRTNYLSNDIQLHLQFW